jgi:hypothetical protein
MTDAHPAPMFTIMRNCCSVPAWRLAQLVAMRGEGYVVACAALLEVRMVRTKCRALGSVSHAVTAPGVSVASDSGARGALASS